MNNVKINYSKHGGSPSGSLPNTGLGNRLFMYFYGVFRCVKGYNTKIVEESDLDDEGKMWTHPKKFATTFIEKFHGAKESDRNCDHIGFPHAYHQGKHDIKQLMNQRDMVVRDFGKESGTFVHVRLGDFLRPDLEHLIAPLDYYRKCLTGLPGGYIASDSPEHEIVQTLISEFDLKVFVSTAEKTMIFGSKFENKVLSRETFSWWIGFIGNQNNVLYPEPLWPQLGRLDKAQSSSQMFAMQKNWSIC